LPLDGGSLRPEGPDPFLEDVREIVLMALGQRLKRTQTSDSAQEAKPRTPEPAMRLERGDRLGTVKCQVSLGGPSIRGC
jgi:hypothetical protein